MTSRFWNLLSALLGLIFLGLLTLNGSILVLATPLLVYLGVAVFHIPGEAVIDVQRKIENGLVEHQHPVRIQLDLSYQGPPVDELIIEDDTPASMRLLDGANRRILPVDGAFEMDFDYTVQVERGAYQFNGILVQVRETFALLQREIFVGQKTELKALPFVPKLRNIEIRPAQTRGFSGPIPARNPGAGISFFGVRDYHLGDSLRHINWKLTSRRMGELFTNEYEGERIADVGLILDARMGSNIIIRGQSIFEFSIQATSAIADSLISSGHRVSFLIYGFGLDRVYPGYGKIQRERILTTLAKARVGSNYALETLNYLPTRLFPARSQLVIISPLGEQDTPAFIRLRKAGYEVLLVSPDPVRFEEEHMPESPLRAQSVRLASLERHLYLQQLVRIGVQVINWDITRPLDQEIRQRLGRQAMIRRNLKTTVSRSI